MILTLFRTRKFIAGLLLCGLIALPTAAVFAQEKQYVTTTLRGRLTETKGKPVVGATLRFTPDQGQAPAVEVTTDVAGAFEAVGLIYANYSIEITTALGEVIKGLNELPIRKDERVEYLLTISPRIASSTSLTNQPQRFVAAVTKPKGKWKKFWKQFAIYMGVTAAVAVVAED